MKVAESRSPRIEMRQAYYSLLQFCPDVVRDERVNIGVILEAPQHNYRAAKYLRYMDRTVKCLDPNADVNLIRFVARELESELNSKDPGKAYDSQPLFLEAAEPTRIRILQETFNLATRSLWRLTEPKPLFIPLQQRFDDRLNLLYNRLVDRASERKTDSWDKSYVRDKAVLDLEKRRVALTLNPEPLPGSFFKENEFDAAYLNDAKTFIQFFSYDIATPDINQLKVFLSSVEDLRKGNSYTSNKGYYYAAVVQPPVHIRNEENESKFQRAVEYLHKREIATFAAQDEHIDLIAEALIMGKDPLVYQPQRL